MGIKVDGNKIKEKIKNIGIDKLLIMIAAGVVLVIFSIPSSKSTTENESKTTVANSEITIDNNTYVEALEQKLSDILSSIEGTGKTRVMITLKSSEEKVVLSEKPITKSDTVETDSEGGNRTVNNYEEGDKVIYVTDTDGNEIPYVVKSLEPVIEGVLVVTEGGNEAVVKEKVINSVTALFNIAEHKITVEKMK